MQVIPKEAFNFLNALEKNNNREWFNENKSRFKDIEEDIKGFFTSLRARMDQHDSIEKTKVFRIYRDVRFSKDKSPYKSNFAGGYSRRGAERRGGYYVHLQPGASFIAVGFWKPEKDDLFRIRKEWEMDASELKEIINDTSFSTIWGKLEGESLKTAPKGFDKEHPEIALLRKKQFIFTRNFTDKQVCAKNFIEEVDVSFKAIRPFFDLMSSILTTNLNGESTL